jgi:hypothetical protein
VFFFVIIRYSKSASSVVRLCDCDINRLPLTENTLFQETTKPVPVVNSAQVQVTEILISAAFRFCLTSSEVESGTKILSVTKESKGESDTD